MVRLAQVACKNTLLVLDLRTKLSVNGVLKGFLRKGDSYLAEINFLYLGEKLNHQTRKKYVCSDSGERFSLKKKKSRFQWRRVLRRRSTAARLLRSWVRILPGAWMSVSFDCCVLSGRCLSVGLITRPEESFRLWCVVCDLETS